MKLLGREPTLWLAVAYAVITVVGTAGFLHFSPEQANLTNAAIAAVVGAINAWLVRPVSPVAFTYAIAALVQLGQAYGFSLPPETLVAVNGLVIPALALLSRNQVSPVESPVTRSTNADEKAVAEVGPAPAATVSK